MLWTSAVILGGVFVIVFGSLFPTNVFPLVTPSPTASPTLTPTAAPTTNPLTITMLAATTTTGGDWTTGTVSPYDMTTINNCNGQIGALSLLNQCEDFTILQRGATVLMEFTGAFATTYAAYRVNGPTGSQVANTYTDLLNDNLFQSLNDAGVTTGSCMWTGVADDGPSWSAGDTCTAWTTAFSGTDGGYVTTSSPASALFTGSQRCDTNCHYPACLCARRSAETQEGPFMLIYSTVVADTAIGNRAAADAVCQGAEESICQAGSGRALLCYSGDPITSAQFQSRGVFNATQMEDFEVRTYSGLKVADNWDGYFADGTISAYRGGVTGLWVGGTDLLISGCNTAGAVSGNPCNQFTDATNTYTITYSGVAQYDQSTTGGDLWSETSAGCGTVSGFVTRVPCMCYVGT